MNQAYDVFLSYHSRDREPVERVAGWLREQGLNPFLDRWYLPAGQPWPQVLERVLGSCRGVAVFIGPGEMGPWQQREKDLALERQSHTPGFPVIPVLLPESVPVAGFLGQNTWVDLRQWIYDPTSIRGESPGSDLPRRVYAPLAELSPYRGLCYFREEDAPFFFGRESAIDSLFATIQHSRLIAVVGASGCGKSSVVRAGLVPKLRQNRQAPWEIITFVPGDDPLKAIAMACLPSLEIEMTEIGRLIEANKLARALASGDASLHDVATRILSKQPGTDGVLLIADQWEELYTLTRDEGIRRRFIDEILESTQRGVLSVVLTLRGDFVGKALAYRPLSDRLQNVQINLGPMNRAELESAIERPAEKVGLAFEPGLAERILDDVGDEPGNLPLLEFVLWELWDERRRGVLLHEAYDQMGGLKGAVATKADNIFDLLSPQDQQAVKKVFLQLVHPGEGVDDSDVTRRRAPRAEIGETAWEVVKKLADARLLVTEHGKEEDTVEVSHEALVRHWERLRSWIKEDWAFLLWHERFRVRFHDWDRSARDKGTLLKGTVLAEARRWLSERREAFSAHQREFIEKSRRVGWIWNVTLITGGVSFVVLVAWLLVTYKVAEAARSEAAAGRLAMAARHEMDENFDLALLLANEANLKNPTPQAMGALVSALSQRPELGLFFWHTHRVSSVAFSPDGKLLASGGADGTIILWDVKSAKPLGEPLREHRGSVHSLGFSADGKWLASGSTDRTVILWSVMSQLKLDKRLRGHQERIVSVAFSPDGKLLASGSWDATVLLWNVASGDRRGTLRGHKQGVLSVAFSNPDGELLASGSADRTVILWDVADPDHPRQHGEPLNGHEGSVYSLSFSSDGKWLGSGSGDKSVILWDVADPDHPRQHGEPLKGQEGSIYGLTFSPDSKLLASGSDSGTIMVWNIETQMPFGEPLRRAGEVMSLVFNQAGQLLASGIDKRAVRLWHVGRRTRIGDFLKEDKLGVTSVAFSPNAKLLASGSEDGTVIFWDIESRRREAMKAQKKALESVAFSASGKVLASGTAGNTIVLWDVEHRKQMGTLEGHEGAVSSVAFSPDGKWLASGSFDGAVILWNTSGKQPTKHKRLGEHKKAVESVAFNPDSTLLASGSADNTVIFWDIRNEGRIDKRLEGRGKPLYGVAFSTDGKLLAAGTADGTIILWDVVGGKQTQPYLKGHKGYVYSVSFSRDGKWVASGGEDGTVILWDIERRASLGQLKGHDSDVLSVAFSADGKWLASGSSDGTVILWDVNLKSWQDRACLTVNRDFTCEEWRRYVGNEPYQRICHRLLPPNADCQTDLP